MTTACPIVESTNWSMIMWNYPLDMTYLCWWSLCIWATQHWIFWPKSNWSASQNSKLMLYPTLRNLLAYTFIVIYLFLLYKIFFCLMLELQVCNKMVHYDLWFNLTHVLTGSFENFFFPWMNTSYFSNHPTIETNPHKQSYKEYR